MEQGVYGGCLLCPLYPLLVYTRQQWMKNKLKLLLDQDKNSYNLVVSLCLRKMSASSFRMALDVKLPKVSTTTVNLDAPLRSRLAKVRKSVNRLCSFTNWLLPWLQLSDEACFIDRFKSSYLLYRQDRGCEPGGIWCRRAATGGGRRKRRVGGSSKRMRSGRNRGGNTQQCLIFRNRKSAQGRKTSEDV